MRVGVVAALVDSEHDGHVRVLGGCRDDYLLGPRSQVLGRVVTGAEEAGRFKHNVHTQFIPRQVFRIALREYLQSPSVDDEGVFLRAHLPPERSVHRVVSEQVSERPRVRQVVHHHELEIFHLPGDRSPEHVPADPSESVYRHTSGHRCSSFVCGTIQAYNLTFSAADFQTQCLARAAIPSPAATC